ncbi:CIA30 family protein [Tropicimonas sp. S265A]|uniref:CIA30 family protein n=1 Tax=Tropicimonas sp. S265A TaxID=3415134 RepID=UPI003C7989D4
MSNDTRELDPKWEFVGDSVMGGVSEGALSREVFRGRAATVLRGAVSLENNGGFVQIASDLRADGSALDASGWDGLEIEVAGNSERYDLRVRTDQLTRPWQSYRAEFTALPAWRTVQVPFGAFVSHKTETLFDPARLRRIGILAIGRVFDAEIAISAIRLYR